MSPVGAVKAVQTVAVIVQDHAEPFGLGSLVEVWGEPEHPEDRTPVFDFRVCTPRPGRVKGRSDYDLFVDRGLEATEDADLICLSPHHDFTLVSNLQQLADVSHDGHVDVRAPANAPGLAHSGRQ